jgi:ubiquitin-conjugating enzyme (huntingtin interacting protein 2)
MIKNLRLIGDIKKLMKDNDLERNGYAINSVNDSNAQIMTKIRGLSGTPYEGGVFEIVIRVPMEYLYSAPNCRFVTNIWHPNISLTNGFICFGWCPAFTIENVMHTIQAILLSPDPTDPQDSVVINQFLNKRNLWEKTAKYWTFNFKCS